MGTESTLTVTGEATVPVSSDVAWLRLVLVVEGKTASEAASASAQRLTIVLDSIREAEAHLPETVTEVERDLVPLFDDSGHLGYRLRRVMKAQMPPEATGVLLDVAIMAGATVGSTIIWGLRDPHTARARASEAALAVAHANAHAAAAILGRELGELRDVDVDSSVPSESATLIAAHACAKLSYAHRPRG